MSWGFSVSRGTGEVLVDDAHVTLAPVYRGDIVTPSPPTVYYNASSGGYTYADLAFGGRYKIAYPAPITSDVPPVVALFPSPQAKGWFHAFRNTGAPGRWTGFEIGHSLKTAWDGTFYRGLVSTSVAGFNTGWGYVAANPEVCPMSTERFGLRVFDSGGKLVFDSGTPVIRIVAPLVSWTRINAARYESEWPFPMDGTHGVLASSLVSYLAWGSNFGNIYISPRIGFSSTRPGKVLVGLGGTDRFSDANLTLSSDRDFRSMLARAGAIQTFVVRVG